MISPDEELETLAITAHGGMVAFHGIGLVWNVQRRNPWWCLFHFLAGLFSFGAVRDHLALRRGHMALVDGLCAGGCGRTVSAPQIQMRNTAVKCVDCVRKMYADRSGPGLDYAQ